MAARPIDSFSISIIGKLNVEDKLVQKDLRKQLANKRHTNVEKRKELDIARADFDALKAQNELRLRDFEAQLTPGRQGTASNRMKLGILRAEFVFFKACIDLHVRELKVKLKKQLNARG